jgi:phosphoglycerol transferase
MIASLAPTSLLCLAGALWLGHRAGPAYRRAATLLASLLGAWLLLALARWTADRFTGNGIDESVLFHLWTGFEGAGVDAYLPLLAMVASGLLACGVASTGFWRLCTRERPTPVPHPRGRRAALASLLLGTTALGLHPASLELGALAQRQVRSLVAAPTPPVHFTPPPTPSLARPLNLVVLYLESVEHTFLDPELFPDLMPRLGTLAQRALRFTGLQQVWGTGWTIAGMTASQCGLPLVTPGDPNTMAGADQFLPGARCLGDVLRTAGYDLHFLGGADLDFAGKGTFYRTHGFEHVRGRDELRQALPDPTYVSPWGLYDDSLYDLATQAFDRLAAGARPFGLFLLTLDTHPPGEHRSASCGHPPQGRRADPMLAAVRCADRLAADFIERILDGPHAERTMVVVLSDHLAMRNSAWDRLERGQRRNLALVFHPDHAPATVHRPGSMLDIAPTLLGLLGAPTPAFAYGRDLLGAQPTLVEAQADQVDDHLVHDQPFLASLWDHPQLYAGMTIDTEARTLTLGRRTIRYPALLELGEGHRVTQVRYRFYSDRGLETYVRELPADAAFIWVDHCRLQQPLAGRLLGDGACLTAGRLGQAQLAVRVLDGTTTLSWRQLQAHLAGTGDDAAAYAERIAGLRRWHRYAADQVVSYPGPAPWQGELVVRSSAYGNDPSEIRSAVLPEARRLPVGLSLLGLDGEGRPHLLALARECPRHEANRLPAWRASLAETVQRHRRRFEAFVVVGHFPTSRSECAPASIEPLFAGSALQHWSAIDGTRPYIGVLAGDGSVHEFVGEPGTSLALALGGGHAL